MARKILLADDSVTAQNMGRKILVDAGYEVITVNNGSAALKRVTESKPDLIVLDVYMPGYSGLEVCQRLKDAAETAHIPVLLTVGKLEPFKPDEARRAQADAHIVKPFEASELLSVLARLEERMVQTDGPRFGTSISGVERFGGERGKAAPSDADTGWKSRLRFPSKKKKEEEVAEDEGGNFRDFRKEKGKAGGNEGPKAGLVTPAGQEPGLVPDIPRDITPEELDALSALAAKLDGPIPAAENIASLAEKVGPSTVVLAKAEAASEAEAKSTPAVDGEKTEVAAAASASNDARSAASEGETKAAEVVADEVPGNVAANTATPTVSAVGFIETPAPIDQEDEPMFAVLPAPDEAIELKAAEGSAADATSGVPAVAPAAEETTVLQPHGVRSFDVVGGRPVPEQIAERITETNKDEQSAVEERGAEIAKTEVAHTDQVAIPTQAGGVTDASATPESAEAEGPAPTDEELAEALRLLTPSTAQGEIATPSLATLLAAGQMLAEEAARTAGSNPRWVAEAVMLTREESSMSLEEEMFRSFAVGPVVKHDSSPTSSVSAITEFVENRMAETDKSASERGQEATVAESNAEAVEASHSSAGSPVTESGENSAKTATTADEEVEGSMPSGTFGDATLREEEQQMSVAATEPEVAEPAAVHIADEKSNLDAGGETDMAKQGKPGSSKSGWHQIRKPPSTTATTDPVEAAKQADTNVEPEDSKAMAAAATGEGGSSAAADASAIASIVDSVLADLRPKIVEEIAKKLGKK